MHHHQRHLQQPPSRPAPPSYRPQDNNTARRWAILREQMACGENPCFGTDRRHVCEQVACRFRAECLAMRAHWKR